MDLLIAGYGINSPLFCIAGFDRGPSRHSSRLCDNIRPCHNEIMSLSRSRTSRVFTISFPEDLATQVEEVAKQESRNISELFREAFRTYRLERMQRKLSSTRAAISARSGPRYTEEDVEALVDEIRAELSPGRKRKA